MNAEEPTFESAQRELEDIVERLERGEATLDQVSRLCATWVRPGGRAPDDREPHLLSVA